MQEVYWCVCLWHGSMLMQYIEYHLSQSVTSQLLFKYNYFLHAYTAFLSASQLRKSSLQEHHTRGGIGSQGAPSCVMKWLLAVANTLVYLNLERV